MADNKPSKELSEYDKYRILRSNSKNVRLDFYHNRVKAYCAPIQRMYVLTFTITG